jgi:hypothetical protein
LSDAISIDFSDPALQADPHPVYRQLRAGAPVVWNDVTQSWLISRYDDIVALLNDARMSSARTGNTFAVLPPEVQEELRPLRHILGSRMLLTDPPTHTRLKNLVMKAFSAKSTQARRERIQHFCDRFLDEVVRKGQMEVMADYAAKIPSWVIADLLGVPMQEQAEFTRWAHDQVLVYDRPGTAHDRVAVMRRGQTSMLEMKHYLERVIEERRREPREDLLSELILAEEQGDRLSNDELVIMVVALLVGGNNSTAHLIGNAVYTLLRHPEALEQLRAEPELIRTTIEEVLRFESPVQATSRVVKEDMTFGGQELRAGQNIHVLLGSGNRDETQFAEPDTFNPTRHPNRHLTFAHGPHYCLGTSVARAVAQTAVLTLVQCCDDLRLLPERVTWIPGFSFHSVESLPISFRAAS